MVKKKLEIDPAAERLRRARAAHARAVGRVDDTWQEVQQALQDRDTVLAKYLRTHPTAKRAHVAARFAVVPGTVSYHRKRLESDR